MFINIRRGLLNIYIRFRALLLFFRDYPMILCCFTILLNTILLAKSFEGIVFEGSQISIADIIAFLPIFLTESLIFFVSHSVSKGVQINRTSAFLLLIGIFTPCLFSLKSFRNLSKEQGNIESFIGARVQFDGVIMSKEGEYQYLFKSDTKNTGLILLKTTNYSVIHAGQRCRILGILVEPESFEDFDYKRYLFRKEIFAILNLQKYECNENGNYLLLLRSKLEQVIEKSMSEPESSLLIGILFGSKRIFTDEFSESLRKSGLSHIISASGYNISLLVIAVDRVFGSSRNKAQIWIKFGFIWIFTIFAGFSSSLVRASTMATIGLVSMMFDRESPKPVLILLCITILVLITPIIIYDIGFLLSSASTIGLIFFPKCFSLLPKFVRNNLLPTISCTIFTLPIVIAFFGKVSLVSVVTNILVTPILQGTVSWGLISTLLTSIKSSFDFLFLIPYLQLTLFKQVVRISSSLPMLEMNFNINALVLLVYGTLILICLSRYPISDSNYYVKKSRENIKYRF